MSFRILSLDGGGSWSLLQVMTLIDLYRSGGALLTGHDVLRDFDLVVASGSGSLVLGGLVKDLPLTEIRRVFEDEALCRSIFAPRQARPTAGARLLRHLTGIGPLYSARAKLDALRRLLNGELGVAGIGDVTLDALATRIDVPAQLMIAAFDYDRRGEIVFRSNIASRAGDFGAPAIATLAEAIHAATTTPLAYFDAPATISRGRRCWDGALAGGSNPVLTGIAEALANGVPAASIEVLSIGTGSVVLPMAGGSEDEASAKLVRQRLKASVGGDLRKLAELLDDPSDSANLIAYLALGHAVPKDGAQSMKEGRLVRLNPLLQPIRVANGWARPAGLIEGDGRDDEFLRLRALGIDAVAADEIALIRKFAALWHGNAVVNQPIRANADTLDCEIGQRWYSEARAHWLSLAGPRPETSSAAPTMPPVVGGSASAATTAWSVSAPRHSGAKNS
jgi:patatin-like phospholipase